MTIISRYAPAFVGLAALIAMIGCAQAPAADQSRPAETAKAVSIVQAGVAKDAVAASRTQPIETRPGASLAMTISEASFGCIRDMKPVRGFYVSNLLGNVDDTVKAASKTEGAVYPVGSVVQLVPTEVMVKREAGYDAKSNDWEFFELIVSGKETRINVRGSTQVVNRFGGNCLTCHAQAQPQYDMICEQTHGCAPIPVTPIMARAIQNTDPRCAPMALPPEQMEALKALAAFAAAAAPKP
jgi:hypothetical protein